MTVTKYKEKRTNNTSAYTEEKYFPQLSLINKYHCPYLIRLQCGYVNTAVVLDSQSKTVYNR